MTQSSELASQLSSRIATVRGKRVLQDSDLAAVYGVSTKRFNEAIKRNHDRFPEDFVFILTNQEVALLKSQIATSSLKVPTAAEENLYKFSPSTARSWPPWFSIARGPFK